MKMESTKGNVESAAFVETEVVAKAKRRRFSASYKRRILRESELLSFVGGVGEMLRKEGLYHSQLAKWRRQSSLGQLDGLAGKKRGRPASTSNPFQAQDIRRLQRERDLLAQKLAQAEAIIDVQKKVSALLSITLGTSKSDGSAS